VATGLTYGEVPVFQTSFGQRTIISLVGAAALLVVTFTGGLLLYEFLLRKFAKQ
jgi:hypothetical protein